MDEHDRVGPGEHRCYARLQAEGEPQSAFSVQLDAPPPSDAGVRARPARESVRRYGRDADAADAGLNEALERIGNR